MKWTNDRADNVDDRRGSGGGGGGMLVGGWSWHPYYCSHCFFLGW